jgi:hypothetical protein
VECRLHANRLTKRPVGRASSEVVRQVAETKLAYLATLRRQPSEGARFDFSIEAVPTS